MFEILCAINVSEAEARTIATVRMKLNDFGVQSHTVRFVGF